MATYERPETVIIEAEVTDPVTAAKIDPATSMQVAISRKGTVVLAATNMTKDDTGEYHYDFQLTDAMLPGDYDIKFIATGSNVSIKTCSIKVS